MLRRRLLARITATRGLLLVGATIGMVLVAGAASASVPSGLQTHGMPFASGSTKKVIVLLRDKAAGLGARSAARSRVIKAQVGPLARTLRTHGATHVTSGRGVPFVVASVSSAQRAALERNSSVRAVFPDVVIPAPKPDVPSDTQLFSPFHPGHSHSSSPTPTGGPSICGTASSPEQDPEALSVINADGATGLGIDGAGITVGYMAGSNDTTIPDFQRNPKYASSGSPAGSPVVSNVNFAGEDLTAPFDVEAFIDASSIAAQGNETWDLSKYVNATHPLPANCDITITGSAPGATVMGLDTFPNTHDETTSAFVQAIDYAVTNGVKVLNQSFGSQPYPDTALDAVRIADDDAVAAGVTVVTSTGDSGVTSTTGSPATDPNVISVGATTTFRTYQQIAYGGINATTPNATNGTWINNNISGLSSGGFSQSGQSTVDLVAPGDLNWIDCSPNTCVDANGNPSGIDFSGGTSEASPLTAGAAADVIQAYQKTHGGAYPTPALVKQILLSTATDIEAPAEQQGAGLLNIGAAVKEAESINHAWGKPQGGLLISPNQINLTQHYASGPQPVKVTNTGSHWKTVNLSSRTLSNKVGSQSGSFCLNPSSAPISCGPPTANTLNFWSGVPEVYQEETFTVHGTHGPSRLNFSANYPYTGQSSLLHVALYDPSGAYAGYSLPQGLANYANIQITDPKPGTWTAVFFTAQNDASAKPAIVGTSGTIQWSADTYTYCPAGHIFPSTLHIAPGATRTAWFQPSPSHDPGDVADSIVLNSSDGTTNTIPVTVRTLVDTWHGGGTFHGVLTGGNGRGNPSQNNTYAFDVPRGQHDIDASVNLGIFDDGVVAYLVDPEGNAVASSSNVTLDDKGSSFLTTPTVDVYKDNPQPGRWMLVLDWLPVEFGTEFPVLSQPFTGHIGFNHVNANSNLPQHWTKLTQGQSYTYDVTVTNTGQSPQTYFLDPRLGTSTTMQLPDLNGSDQNMTLPLAPGTTFPIYDVPSNTSSVQASLTGSAPVTFDTGPFSGDPDVQAVQNGNSASATYSTGDEVQPGLWYLNPSQVGPYSGAAPAVNASASLSVTTQAFDPTVDPSTGDLWLVNNGLSSTFAPVYLNPGESATIPLTITPSASSGTHVTGFINLDDAFQFNLGIGGQAFASGDELASFPFSYTVK